MVELKDGMRLNPELNAKLDDHELEYKEITTRMEGYHDRESKRMVSKMFIEKGWWRAAQSYCFADKSNNSKPEFVDFLVILKLEMGHIERATGLCRDCCGFLPDPQLFHYDEEIEITNQMVANIGDFISAENVIWVDTKDVLVDAARHFAEVEMVAIDSEWIIESPRNHPLLSRYTVSILQIATLKKVFIFDLIKLSASPTERKALDNCLKPLFCSDGVLKLGYALENDVEQLFYSYGELDCFKYWEVVLDLQKVHDSRDLKNFTSWLLRQDLDKRNQMSNWGRLPLNQSQMEYAALDAYIVLPMFFITINTISGWESNICSWRPNFRSSGYEELHPSYIWRDKERRKKQRTSRNLIFRFH